MSYFIIPKVNNFFIIEPIINSYPLHIYTSNSVHDYYNKSIMNLCEIFDKYDKYDNSYNLLEQTLNTINPHEYIYTNIPSLPYSVSKLHMKNKIFYDLLEILHTLNVFDLYKNIPMTHMHICGNYLDSIECVSMFRVNPYDTRIFFKRINSEIYKFQVSKCDFIFYDTIENINYNNINEYTLYLVEFLMLILKFQNNKGCTIIKISHLFYKPVIDILYIITSLYDKVYIIKPSSSNVTSFEKYIVCKGFILNKLNVETHNIYYYKLLSFIINYHNKKFLNIHTLLKNEIPCYLLNKIDDINITLGQQQLEYIGQIINIYKNKNKEDKLESIKKMNIQKSISWCEKYNVPHNKIQDKTNFFLPTKC